MKKFTLTFTYLLFASKSYLLLGNSLHQAANMNSIYQSVAGGIGDGRKGQVENSEIEHDLHIYTPQEESDRREEPPKRGLEEDYVDTDPYCNSGDCSDNESGVSTVSPSSPAKVQDLEGLDSHFSILATSPVADGREDSATGSRASSSPKNFPPTPVSPIPINPPLQLPSQPLGDESSLRAGSMRGISLRAKMEFQQRGESRSFSWKSGFFTFNEVRMGGGGRSSHSNSNSFHYPPARSSQIFADNLLNFVARGPRKGPAQGV